MILPVLHIEIDLVRHGQAGAAAIASAVLGELARWWMARRRERRLERIEDRLDAIETGQHDTEPRPRRKENT